jgi:uncharacterized protein YndB with AHSA1/START domain
MAHNETLIHASPEQVFDVLLDPWAYPQWVVGAKRIRGVDREWPQPGSRFHHQIGVGPLALNDSSRLVEVDPPRRIALEVRFRPAGVGLVAIEALPRPDGTRVTMDEQPLHGPFDWLWGRPVNWLVEMRNRKSLDRLRALVESRVRRVSMRDEPAPPSSARAS